MTPLARDLLSWFAAAQRLLPWREARTPYRVWVSEVMLQQTQVATVIPYFKRWLEQFPTPEALADAPLSDVLKAWEGLGYYQRAHLLHEGAKVVVARHGGAIPESYGALLELPGIGPYSAAAIASLAFGERVLAVDGNVKRVAARFFCLPGEPKARTVEAQLGLHLPETEALHIGAGAFNEALMELGATVCTPRSPRCEGCPVRAHCEAFGSGQVTRFPEPKVRRRVPQVHRFALIHRSGSALWLRERPTDEMLGGLWGFVLSDVAPPGEQLEPVGHTYTHFKITATPVVVDTPPEIGRWVGEVELGTLALSRLDYKILDRLRETEPLD